MCARCSKNKDEGDEGGVGVQVHQARGEVTLAVVAIAERDQPSVLGHEEVTQHHCLVRLSTPGSPGETYLLTGE